MIVIRKKILSIWITKLGCQSGFTLLETIIGLAILMVGLLAIGSMQSTALEVNGDAYDISEATALAEEHLERLLGLPYNDDSLQEDANPHTLTNPPTGYVVEWNITDGVDTNNPVPNTKAVSVTVRWQAPYVRSGQTADRTLVVTSVRPQFRE